MEMGTHKKEKFQSVNSGIIDYRHGLTFETLFSSFIHCGSEQRKLRKTHYIPQNMPRSIAPNWFDLRHYSFLNSWLVTCTIHRMWTTLAKRND